MSGKLGTSHKHLQRESDLPVIIAIAKSSNRDLKGLPHWVQRILHHLCLVADRKPAEERKTREERKKRFEGREGEIEKGMEKKSDLRSM